MTMIGLGEFSNLIGSRKLEEAAQAEITVYPITVVKFADQAKASPKPPTYNYLDEETRRSAAINFLEDGATIRYEDPYETDRGSF